MPMTTSPDSPPAGATSTPITRFMANAATHGPVHDAEVEVSERAVSELSPTASQPMEPALHGLARI
eukprot:8888603-Prorocentrum_lima.AAC.1